MGGISMGQHECAATGCHTEISVHKLMCAYHWFKVPPDLRREVSASYQVYRAYRGSRTARDRYFAVREQAIEALS